MLKRQIVHAQAPQMGGFFDLWLYPVHHGAAIRGWRLCARKSGTFKAPVEARKLGTFHTYAEARRSMKMHAASHFVAQTLFVKGDQGYGDVPIYFTSHAAYMLAIEWRADCAIRRQYGPEISMTFALKPEQSAALLFAA